MKQTVLLIALLVSMQVWAYTSEERDVERKLLYERVTINYNSCIERGKRNFNPKTDDGIKLIIQCRDWAIMTTS